MSKVAVRDLTCKEWIIRFPLEPFLFNAIRFPISITHPMQQYARKVSAAISDIQLPARSSARQP